MRVRTAVIVAGVVGWACAAMGQPDPLARQKLEQAADTIKNLTALSYRMTHRSEGLFGLDQRAETAVKMLRASENPTRWLVLWSGTIKTAGEEETSLLANLDQQTGMMTWVDDQKQEWIRKPERDFRQGPNDRKAFAWIAAIADHEPLKDQIDAPEMEVQPDETVDGVLCDVILVRPEKSQPRRWAIGKEDHLIRRLEWVFEGGGMSGRWLFQMAEVTANPELTPADFSIPVPDGYRKVEPAPPPPPPTTTGTRTDPRAPGAAPATTIRNIGTAVGDLAPDFELVLADVEGAGSEERVRLSSLHGRVVVLDFWGSWNVKSKSAAPEMHALVEKFKGQPVRVLGMTIREKDKAKPIRFMKEHGYEWSILLDADEIAKQYRVRVFPTYYVIDGEGVIVHTEVGFEKEKTMTALTAAIEKALASSAAVISPAGGDDGAGGR